MHTLVTTATAGMLKYYVRIAANVLQIECRLYQAHTIIDTVEAAACRLQVQRQEGQMLWQAG